VAGVGLTEEQARRAEMPYVVGRCNLAETARGAIAGRGGRLKLIFRADDRKLLGVHCIGDIASEMIGLGHAVIAMGGTIELLLTLGLNMPTYGAAYHDAAIDGLSRLAGALGLPSPMQHFQADVALATRPNDVGELVREVSRSSGLSSH
jgi:NAD(P) transhydrogenase